MSTKIIKYIVVAEIGVPEDRVNEILSWQGREWDNGFTPENYVESVIKDHVQDRGMLCKIDANQAEVYNDVKEYTYKVITQKAVEELEAEILDSKQCIGGSCED